MRDTAIFQVGQLALIIFQATSNFFLIRILRRDLYGAYTLILATAALAGTLDVTGAGRVTITQLSQSLGADDRDQVRDSLAYFLKINLLYNVPVVLLFAIISPQITWQLYHNRIVSHWVGWLALIELIDIPTQIVGLAYQSRGAVRGLISYETSRVVLSTVATLLLLFAGRRVGALILSSVLISVLYALLSIVRYRRLCRNDERFPTWPELLRRARTVPNRGRFKLGFLIAIDKNLGSLIDTVLVMFIGTLGLPALGDYSIARKIVTLPQPLIGGISRNLDTFLPRRAGQSSQNQAESLRTTFVQTTVYTAAIWSVITLGIALVGPILLLIAFPDYQMALPMIFPLLLQSMGIGLGPGVGPMVRTLKRVEFAIVVQFVGLLLIVPAGWLLVQLFGEYGAGWLTGLLELCMTLVLDVGLLWITRSTARPVKPAAASQP